MEINSASDSMNHFGDHMKKSTTFSTLWLWVSTSYLFHLIRFWSFFDFFKYLRGNFLSCANISISLSLFGQRPQRTDVLLDTGVNFFMSIRPYVCPSQAIQATILFFQAQNQSWKTQINPLRPNITPFLLGLKLALSDTKSAIFGPKSALFGPKSVFLGHKSTPQGLYSAPLPWNRP